MVPLGRFAGARPQCAWFAALWMGCASGCLAQELPSAPVPQVQPGHTEACQPTSLGALGGQVQKVDGSLMEGAHLTLSPAAGSTTIAAERSTTSDVDGQFRFCDLVPGTYTLSTTLSGFNTATQQVTAVSGKDITLAPVELSLGMVSISVTAITPEQAAVEQVHLEEHQRLIGLLPNFFVSYNWSAGPLTSSQKFQLATHTVLDPGNLVLAGLVAGVQHADNAFPGYGQGAAGYSKRFGADLGNLVIGTYLGGAIFPSLFHQDPRYFYKGTGSKRSRFLYAISRSILTRGDNGHQQPNFSGILGDLSAGAISNAYYPASDRQGATLFLENSVLAIGGDALTGFVQEFVFSHFTMTKHAGKDKSQP